MTSIRSSPDRDAGGARPAGGPVWWRALLTASAMLLLVLAVGRAFDLAESPLVPRSGIGEVRWHGFAVRPDLHPALAQWLETVARGGGSTAENVELSGTYDLSRVQESDRRWLLTMLRYACPASAVELDGGALSVEVPCRPDLPEFLTRRKPSAGWVWLVTMGSFLLLGVAVTAQSGRAPSRESPSPGSGGLTDWSRWILAGLVGWSLAACSAGMLWALGVRSSPSFLWLAGAVAGALILQRRRVFSGLLGACAGSRPDSHSWTMPEWLQLGTGTLLVLVGVGKILRTEVWSWDYVAAWGFRARKIASGSLEFLDRPGFEGSNPDYPLGLAFTWLVGTAGAPPSGGDVRLVTVVMLLALGGLLLSILGRVFLPLRVLVVGAMIGGPLIWDTEGLGLAELPLVLWTTAAVALWSRGGATAAREAGWCSLLFLTMLAWTKQEGLVMAAALGLPGALWMRARRGGLAAGLWLGGLFGSLTLVRLLTSAQTDYGTSFLDGDVWGRLSERLRAPLDVLVLLPETLLHPQWMLWYVPLGILTAALMRSRPLDLRSWVGPALIVASALLAAAYVAVYFATYLEPADHVATSWHRILGPVLWTLFLGVSLTTMDLKSDPWPGSSDDL